MGKSVSDQVNGLKIEGTIQKTCKKFKDVLNDISKLLKEYSKTVDYALQLRKEIFSANTSLIKKQTLVKVWTDIVRTDKEAKRHCKRRIEMIKIRNGK